MEQLVKLVVSKIEELIGVVGGKIEAYYPYVVKQQVTKGVSLLVFMALLSIVLVFCVKLEKKNSHYKGLWVGAAIFLFIAIIMFVFEGFPRLINPHFYAVKDILEMTIK